VRIGADLHLFDGVLASRAEFLTGFDRKLRSEHAPGFLALLSPDLSRENTAQLRPAVPH
jgi:hypothetical protein